MARNSHSERSRVEHFNNWWLLSKETSIFDPKKTFRTILCSLFVLSRNKTTRFCRRFYPFDSTFIDSYFPSSGFDRIEAVTNLTVCSKLYYRYGVITVINSVNIICSEMRKRPIQVLGWCLYSRRSTLRQSEALLWRQWWSRMRWVNH